MLHHTRRPMCTRCNMGRFCMHRQRTLSALAGTAVHAKGAALLSEGDPFMIQENLEREIT